MSKDDRYDGTERFSGDEPGLETYLAEAEPRNQPRDTFQGMLNFRKDLRKGGI